MALFIGADDTDARSGGCTTWLAARIADAFPLPLAGPPRLVRLNPNVPWKTRGNAAIALAFDGRMDLAEAERRVGAVVSAHARVEADGTDPGWVVSERPLDPALYEAAVSRIVERAEADHALAEAGARAGGLKAARGVIGAAAALAWDPGSRDHTFEAIAYRERARWGTPRRVEEASVRAIESRFPATFDSYDFVNEEVVMVPASPCPVLFGVRAEDPREADAALRSVASEPVAGSTLFVTNQGTDDHLRVRTIETALPLTNARLRLTVSSGPKEHGGHVFVRACDEDGSEIDLAAFAPTRGFRRVVATLAPGDRVVACGAVRATPEGARLLGLEKIRVDATTSRLVKVANPACGACARSMRSRGRGGGYRCDRCGAKAAESEAVFARETRDGLSGWHEVPACARRHLAMPLKRMGSPFDRERRIEV